MKFFTSHEKTSIENDLLNRCSNGIAKTNLQCMKNLSDILSGPEQVL